MDRSSHYVAFAVKTALSIVLASILTGSALIKWRPLFCLRTIERISNFWNGYIIKTLTLPDGFTFEYIERGEKSKCKHTLLLLHGFSGSKSEFNMVTRYLPKEDFHIIAVDLPGHGGTTRDVINGYKLTEISKRIKQFVDGVGLSESRFHLLGFSFGGLLAGIHAIDHPADVQSLTLMSSAGFKVKPELMDAHMKVKENMQATFEENITVDGLKQIFGSLIPGKKLPPDFIMAAIFEIRCHGREYFKRVMEELIDPEKITTLDRCKSSIKTPTLIMWGLDDTMVFPPDDARIAAGMPALKKFVAFENCGHLVNMEQPQRCAAELQLHIETYCNASD